MSVAGRVRSVVGVLGELLMTAGVVIALFAVYTLFWTGVETADAQEALEQEFVAADRPRSAPTQTPATTPGRSTNPESSTNPAPQAAPADPAPGDAYARMRIPRLGEQWEWIVVQGVDLYDLRSGPGHYEESAGPGEVGNFAVAGHRATYGEPFAYLDQLQPGDEILVDRQGDEHRYVVTEWFITTPGDSDVLAPVPGRPDLEPTEAVITLTTCHPRWGSTERLIVHGVLADDNA